MRATPSGEYDKNVFINCPFDDTYLPLFRAITFTTAFCGFKPRCALETMDAGEVRMVKILRLIRECRLGLHDISRTALDETNSLPRFNMPLELGLFLGAFYFGNKAQRRKVTLVLDVDRYRYQKFVSDIAGQDIKAHRNDPFAAVSVTREWLNGIVGRPALPGGKAIATEYRHFMEKMPVMLKTVQLHESEISFPDWMRFIEEWIAERLAVTRSNIP